MATELQVERRVGGPAEQTATESILRVPSQLYIRVCLFFFPHWKNILDFNLQLYTVGGASVKNEIDLIKGKTSYCLKYQYIFARRYK